MDEVTRRVLEAGEEALAQGMQGHAGRDASVPSAARMAALPVEGQALPVERAAGVKSRQPRFDDGLADRITWAVMNWVKSADIEEPAYEANSMRRDAWLQQFWRREPQLAGVVNGVTLLDANRGWSLVGGRNQVRRYVSILHETENGAGWRRFFRKSSLSYWTTDMGSVTEVGREGRRGPLRALWHVDPARCRLTGDVDRPLQYNPARGGRQEWRPEDYFRVVSLESDDEQFLGLGYSALSRALELAKIMVAIYQHDQEQLLARAPRGLLLLQGISEQQWEESLQAREATLDGMERQYYAGVQVLATAGIEQLDAKLVSLSQLPAEFDRRTFVDQLMYGYALCFGYDPSEFWPVQFGAVGRGTETEVQHLKATGKGGLDFVLAFAERLERELPETVAFAFDQRDEEGDRLQAEVALAQVDVVKRAYEAGQLGAEGALLTREEARSMLAEYGVIPQEWTEIEENYAEADRNERWLEDARVQRAMEVFPDEPIVRYVWPGGREIQITNDKFQMAKPAGMRGLGDVRKRFTTENTESTEGKKKDVLYEGEGFEITTADVARAIEEGRRRVGEEFGELLMAGNALTPQPPLPEGEGESDAEEVG